MLRRRWLRLRTVHGRLLTLAAALVAVPVLLRLGGSLGASGFGPGAAGGPAAPGAGRATVSVAVAAADLPAGHVITHSDIVQVAWPNDTAPGGALDAPVGRVLAGPVRRGEPVTDARVLGAGLLHGQPSGTRAVTLRVADPAGATLALPGDRVDVLAAASDAGAAAIGLPTSASADVIVEGALVLAVPGTRPVAAADDTGPAAGEGLLGGGVLDAGSTAGTAGAADGDAAGLLVLAVDGAQARRLAAVAGSRTLSVALRPSG